MSTATETPAKTETKTETKTPPPRGTDDKFMAAVLGDMGKIVGENGEIKAAPAEEAIHQTIREEFTTMGEHARFAAEKKESDAAAAAKTDDKKEEKNEEKAAEGAGATTTTKEEGKTAETKATETKAEEKPKIKVEKGVPLEKLVEGILAKQQQKATAEKATTTEAQPKKEEKTTEDPDAAYIECLDRKQKKTIELARFAAKQDPKKFGNMPKRWLEYFKKVDAYVDEKRKEDAEWDPDNDAGYDAFIEDNRPAYDGVDEEDLREQMIEARVEEKVQSKVQPKIDAQAEAQFIQELKPEIDAASESYRGEVPKRFIIDEKSEILPVVKKLQEKGMTEEAWREAKAINPRATKIVKAETDRAAALGRELLELTSGVTKQVPFNPALPMNHEQNLRAVRQQQLYGFIDGQEAYFNQNGGDAKVRGNKTFLPRRQFFALAPSDQEKHWTVSAQDVLEMLAIDTGVRAESAYKAAIKELEEEGYVRKTEQKETKTETKVEPKETKKTEKEESPKASSSPGPGSGKGAGLNGDVTLMPKEEFDRMWSGGIKV
jgi:hypothetical protein